MNNSEIIKEQNRLFTNFHQKAQENYKKLQEVYSINQKEQVLNLMAPNIQDAIQHDYEDFDQNMRTFQIDPKDRIIKKALKNINLIHTTQAINVIIQYHDHVNYDQADHNFIAEIILSIFNIKKGHNTLLSYMIANIALNLLDTSNDIPKEDFINNVRTANIAHLYTIVTGNNYIITPLHTSNLKQLQYHPALFQIIKIFIKKLCASRAKINKSTLILLTMLSDITQNELPAINKEKINHQFHIDNKTSFYKYFKPKNSGNFKKHFKNFHDPWRMVLDFAHQQYDKNVLIRYGHEYIIGIFNAFRHLVKTAEQPITLDLIKELHRLCLQDEEGYLKEDKSFFAGEFFSPSERDIGSHFPVNNLLTYHGYLELRQNENIILIPSINKITLADIIIPQDIKNHVSYRVIKNYKEISNLEQMEVKLQEAIDNYYQELKIAVGNPEKILTAIVRMIRGMELIHPFPDGNARIFCVLLLNRELINNGFSPVILDNTALIDLCSIDEIVYNILPRTMNNFHMLKQKNLPKYMQTTKELLQNIEESSPIRTLIKDIAKKDLWQITQGPPKSRLAILGACFSSVQQQQNM